MEFDNLCKLVESKQCPEAITNRQLNQVNKAKAALDDQVAYMHPDAAKKIVSLMEQNRLCGNCISFDVSEHAKKCGVPVDDGYGYCVGYDFMCHKDKTCLSHGEGGPKTE